MFTRVCASAVVCLGLATTASAGPITAYEMFPLENGNTWVYATDSEGYLAGTTGVNVIEVQDEAYLGSNWYANYVEGLLGHGDWFYDNTNHAEMWVYEGGWSEQFDFDAPTGSSWTADAGACDTYTMTLATTTGAGATPSGDFTGLTDFHMSRQTDPAVRCGNAPLHNIRFAYGVGPVDYATAVEKGHLMYARVGGTVVAAGPSDTRTLDGLETSFVLTTETPTQPHGIYCFTTPCNQPVYALGFAFALTNVSGSTQTLHFADGQRFEVDITDGHGNGLSWSDDQLFTQATGTVVLEPGQTEVFHGNLPLGAGGPLLGAHQVVGYLVNTEGAGKLSVDIDIQPAP